MVTFSQALSLLWLALIGAGVLMHLVLPWAALLPALLKEAITYGKLREGQRLVYGVLSVPKRYFVHFYAWGTVWNYLLLYMFVTECLMGEQLAGVPVLGLWPILARLDLSVSNCCSVVTLHCVEVLLVLVMVCCQVTRRLYECLFVSVFSESSMHVIHYLLGFFFYTALGPTALQHLHGSANGSSEVWVWHWYHIVAVLLFIWASRHQWVCHSILSSLRNRDSDSRDDRKMYKIPHGDWFSHLSCPHYSAEVIIYCALFVAMGGNNWVWLLVIIFTATTLFLSGRQTHRWYKTKFKNYPSSRTVMIPYVL